MEPTRLLGVIISNRQRALFELLNEAVNEERESAFHAAKYNASNLRKRIKETASSAGYRLLGDPIQYIGQDRYKCAIPIAPYMPDDFQSESHHSLDQNYRSDLDERYVKDLTQEEMNGQY